MRIEWGFVYHSIEMRAAGKNDHGCIEFRLRLNRRARRRAPPQKDFTSLSKPEVRLWVENAGRMEAGERAVSTLVELDPNKTLDETAKRPWETMAEIQARLHEAAEEEWRRRQGRKRQGHKAEAGALSRTVCGEDKGRDSMDLMRAKMRPFRNEEL